MKHSRLLGQPAPHGSHTKCLEPWAPQSRGLAMLSMPHRDIHLVDEIRDRARCAHLEVHDPQLPQVTVDTDLKTTPYICTQPW